MSILHTFGCSITQGHALPDVVRPILDAQGQPLPDSVVRAQLEANQIKWEDIHLYQPSEYAWPSILAQQLDQPVINHARRGACTQQIARQVVTNCHTITHSDTVIVMWTYLSRISYQWPARTAVPLCNVIDPWFGWRSRILPGFNKFFGLDRSDSTGVDRHIQEYIQRSVEHAHLDPMGVFNQYYNNLVLQVTVDGLLRSTGARVIHLSVEPDPYLDQLDRAVQDLDVTLQSPWHIPDPHTWYTIHVDHDSCLVIHDPTIPPAENDMHPSVHHHVNFAQEVYEQYFSNL